MEKIPSKYFISKGVIFETLNEEDSVPEIELECYEYTISKGEDGYFVAQCNELGAVTQGKDWEELKDNILETHSLILDDDRIPLR